MDIRAIVLVGGNFEPADSQREQFANVPLARLDVLGTSVEERVLERLQRFGVSLCTLVSDVAGQSYPSTRHTALHEKLNQVHASGDQYWEAAEEAFKGCAEDGAEIVLVLRLGPYVEVDYDEMIQHHLDRRSAVTQAVDSDNENLDLFVLSASARTDVSELFQSRLQRIRRESEPFRVSGYVNRLRSAADLRRLALDGLLGKNGVVPQGKEVKPGIWMGPAARVHRKARVVAPAYIGAHAKVRASALITRGTAIECHAEVDCGTVVENSTLLPFTCLGAGLDAVHCVVGFRRIAQLARQVEVEIYDHKLVDMVPLSAVSRLAGSTAALFAFLPKKVYRGLAAPWRGRARRDSEPPEAAEPALESSSLEAEASTSEPSEFPSNLAVVRRYGDH